MCRSDSHANPSCCYLDPYTRTLSYRAYRHPHINTHRARPYSHSNPSAKPF